MIEDFWQQNASSQSISAWRGYAFENLCFNHILQIKKALGIPGVSSKQSAWIYRDASDGGAQIDLIIERRDHIVNMCEIKFCGDAFIVDKKYDLVLRNRASMLSELIDKKSVIHHTLISAFGVYENEYRWIFERVITLDDLFAE